ncbi:MAG TPA: ROK family protein [Treponema sp.]|nr:MAG: hypothetical protein A2001_04920 [Treponema sp. GWC1_61_84]OHE65077.1 MAG: hypothetical protein A2Y36_13565 [Treponema sp. GWA1_62_8]OHE71190.1 MAG: hypothetical protein A2413_05440 [Treponema sp. RIFOXYC1_FULL_61_9]HCM27024.1 ROK family protein [Treponema sp.]
MNAKIGNRPKNIRSQNKKLIVDLFRTRGPQTVSDISAIVKLSRTTVMKINDELLAEQIIIEAGKGASTDEGGKKPTIYCLKAQSSLIVTFYIHYRAIHFTLFDLQVQALVKAKLPVVTDEPLPSIIAKMRELFMENTRNLPSDHRLLACIVAIHSNMDSEKGICLHATYFPSWGTNIPIRDEIVSALGIGCPVHVENFIRIKAFAEMKMGLAKGHSSALIIDAGWHGITAGLLIDEKLYQGKHSLSGEIGHMILHPFDTVQCGCGGYGCFESLISFQRLLDDAERALEQHPQSSLANHRGNISLQLFFEAAEAGDVLARLLMDNVINWFARGFSNLITIFDPEMIIVEGDYAAAGQYFQTEVCRRSKHLTLLRLVRETPIIFSYSESNSSVVLSGAAAIAIDKYFN